MVIKSEPVSLQLFSFGELAFRWSTSLVDGVLFSRTATEDAQGTYTNLFLWKLYVSCLAPVTNNFLSVRNGILGVNYVDYSDRLIPWSGTHFL